MNDFPETSWIHGDPEENLLHRLKASRVTVHHAERRLAASNPEAQAPAQTRTHRSIPKGSAFRFLVRPLVSIGFAAFIIVASVLLCGERW